MAFELVRVNDLTGPETFAGMANVVVFVTSPLIFVVTPGLEVGDGIAVTIGEGFGQVLSEIRRFSRLHLLHSL